MHNADIIYANPTDALHLMAERGFVLLAKPKDMSDEVVFVAHTGISNPTLASFQGVEFATVCGLMPTSIALSMLHQRGIVPAGMQHRKSWQAVIRSIWNDEVQYGIVYKDTYDGLSQQGKSMVQVVATSQESIAFHAITLAPSLASRQAEIEQLFLGMHADARGQEVLAELHIPGWLPIAPEEIARMQHVAATYC
ncbi:MAG: phosphate/phosphite/phosphonate ABC transporter substrate-binding protein [Blastochloris sp.]|nr:phosphate/phosphite/phosphonate ABC transporter substrate-binding protein [Blastochloris sp.]